MHRLMCEMYQQRVFERGGCIAERPQLAEQMSLRVKAYCEAVFSPHSVYLDFNIEHTKRSYCDNKSCTLGAHGTITLCPSMAQKPLCVLSLTMNFGYVCQHLCRISGDIALKFLLCADNSFLWICTSVWVR